MPEPSPFPPLRQDSGPRLPPIWVLHAPRVTARRKMMTEQLDGLGVKWESVEGVDAQALDMKKVDAYSERASLRDLGRPLVPGELACVMSHMAMWKRIVDEGLPEVLILEDDIRVGVGLLSVLAARERLPADYELINFLTDVAQVPFGPVVADIYRASRHQGNANRASCYLLKHAGAEKLLAFAQPIRMTPDEITGRTSLSRVHSYGVSPPAASLTDLPSSIWQNDRFPGFHWMDKKRYLVRQIYYLSLDLLGFKG
jgi:glycosyl transferase, family 25